MPRYRELLDLETRRKFEKALEKFWKQNVDLKPNSQAYRKKIAKLYEKFGLSAVSGGRIAREYRRRKLPPRNSFQEWVRRNDHSDPDIKDRNLTKTEMKTLINYTLTAADVSKKLKITPHRAYFLRRKYLRSLEISQKSGENPFELMKTHGYPELEKRSRDMGTYGKATFFEG